VMMRRFDFPTAPVIVGMILGPMAEAQFRNAMSIGEGKLSVFVERPLSAAVLVICVVLILLPMWLRRRKALVPAEAAPD
jgi:putative tricarboxylic transport membrane protein